MTNERADIAETKALQSDKDAAALPATLGEFIRERAETLGNKVAGDWFQDSERLTYCELDEKADRLASSLVNLGVRKGCHVAVMLPSVPETMISWTALGRIGAVMVPVNTAYTPTELSFVINDSDVQYLIIHDSCLEIFDKMAGRPEMLIEHNVIVCGGTTGERQDFSTLVTNGDHPFVPPVQVAGSDLLNIQYTSGTTGFPKGCMLTHDYWIRTGYSLAVTRGRDHGIENALVWPPFFYMDGMWQILSAFFHGATAFIARRMSMRRFMDWLIEYDIHTCTFPEPALKTFPPSPADNNVNLKYVYAFGWRPESKRQAEQRFGCHARDCYGMTEIGTATVTPVAAAEHNFERTCGLPTIDRQLKIVDDAGNPVKQGEPGELWVTGPGIMWGYYKRPEANAEVFRGAWFRTGDIFRQNAAGYYFIIGRNKEMVKRSGENIAAREVEAVLNEMPEIVESAIVPVPDEVRREEVKAYVRLQDGLRPVDCPPAAIIAHCESHLAQFKQPRYIAYIEEFPRTATRKIAKQRMLDDADDLRLGAFDRAGDVWR
ncbi:MAG: acyl--CoA ligase [Hyphomicrobiales bacterium]|nr:acyl--CoA ligase [Hyphomicrobiales bacterium]